MNALSLTGALAGVLFGYAAQRGDFCMATGLGRAVRGRDYTRLRALGLALGIQMLLVPLLFLVGLAEPGLPACYPIAGVLGGVLFGASLRWAGGCSASLFYKAGSGQPGAWVGLAGLAAGVSLLELGPLRDARAALQGLGGSLGHWDLAASLGLPLSVLSPLLGAVLVPLLWRAGPGRVGAWSWRTTALAVGLIGTFAWPLSARYGRDFGLALLPGLVGLVRLPARGVAPHGAWDLLFVLAIPLGGFLAALRDPPARGPQVDAALFWRRLVGGLGLGVGASLAAGETLAHGLTGLPLLATGSVVTCAGIWFGCSLSAARD